MGEDKGVRIEKGTRVLVQRMKARLAPLSGMQMKTGMHVEQFEAVITNIYGNHPTEPTEYLFKAKKDDGEVVEVEQRHIIAVIKEEKDNEADVQVRS